MMAVNVTTMGSYRYVACLSTDSKPAVAVALGYGILRETDTDKEYYWNGVDTWVLRELYDGGETDTHTHVGGGEHPDLATHDTLGLATQAELAAHDSDADAHHVAFVQADHDALANPHHSNANDHANTLDHAEVHTVASHSDTTATGAELEELTDGSETALHTHAGGGGGDPKLDSWPIGSVFLAVVDTSPATLLGGGTWEQIAQGRMLVGQDGADADFDVAEEIGGAKTHTHTSHTGTSKPANGVADIASGELTHNAANHMNPYFVVYIWKRTA